MLGIMDVSITDKDYDGYMLWFQSSEIMENCIAYRISLITEKMLGSD